MRHTWGLSLYWLFRKRGYTGMDYRSAVFPGAAHTEDAWAARLDRPMTFLLPPRR